MKKIMILVLVISLSMSNIVFANEVMTTNDEIIEVYDNGHGEMSVSYDSNEIIDTRNNVMLYQDTSTNKVVLKGNDKIDGLYNVISNNCGYEYVVNVGNGKFQAVGKITINPSNKSSLRTIQMKYDLSDDLIEEVERILSTTDASNTKEVQIYTPNAINSLAVKDSTLARMSSVPEPYSYYYNGKGNKKYKDEIIFSFKTSVKDRRIDAEQTLLEKHSNTAEVIVGGVPYIGPIYSYGSAIVDLIDELDEASAQYCVGDRLYVSLGETMTTKITSVYINGYYSKKAVLKQSKIDAAYAIHRYNQPTLTGTESHRFISPNFNKADTMAYNYINSPTYYLEDGFVYEIQEMKFRASEFH